MLALPARLSSVEAVDDVVEPLFGGGEHRLALDDWLLGGGEVQLLVVGLVLHGSE